jgi:hypothetical protein
VPVGTLKPISFRVRIASGKRPAKARLKRYLGRKSLILALDGMLAAYSLG